MGLFILGVLIGATFGYMLCGILSAGKGDE